MTRVREIHQQTKGVYGSRRIAERMQGMGYPVGRYRGPQPDAESEVIGQTQQTIPGDYR
ncbi:MAG: IS3 family transposase [Dehalococcoidia bacterium]